MAIGDLFFATNIHIRFFWCDSQNEWLESSKSNTSVGNYPPIQVFLPVCVVTDGILVVSVSKTHTKPRKEAALKGKWSPERKCSDYRTIPSNSNTRPRMRCQLRRGIRGRIGRKRCRTAILGGFCAPMYQGFRKPDVGSHQNGPQTVCRRRSYPVGAADWAEKSLALLPECPDYL